MLDVCPYCGERWRDHDGMNREWCLEKAVAEIKRLREIVVEYADHQSRRCAHPDRFRWDPDCPCGLTRELRDAGFEGPFAAAPITLHNR